MLRDKLDFEVQCIQDQSCSNIRFNQPKHKKYILSKMITAQQKEIKDVFKNVRKKKKHPEYFSQMVRQQKKNMFVNTFVKKLKNSIIHGSPPTQYTSIAQNKDYQEWQSLELQKTLEIITGVTLFCQIVPLLIMTSLSIVFHQISTSEIYIFYVSLSVIFHIIQMVKKLLFQRNYQDKKIHSLKGTMIKYVYSLDFVIDILVFIAFFLVLIFSDTYNSNSQIVDISKFFMLLKVKSLINVVNYMQLVLIQNEYRGQLWALVKVFLFNFVVAHCITIFLILMADFQPQDNWIVKKQIFTSEWHQKYIWGFYWATTIMLSVGFGDIVPTNKSQALCMIFVQTVGCIVLAYNISQVGSIISKIKSYDEQKNKNIKVFNHISEQKQLDSQICDKITNYIKQSTVIKRNYNIEQQNAFVNNLPLSFKHQLLQQMNKKIWNGMKFFQNLSEKTLLGLSKYIQKKLTHPQEIVYTRGQPIDIMIFNHGRFGFSYNNGGNLTQNGKIIQSFHVKENQYRIASLDFLLQQSIPYDIKCIDYVIFYRVSFKQFLKVLENNTYDYEYFCMVKDKDQFLLNQFQISKCQICKNQRHTLFRCPRLHYIPLKQHVIQKCMRSIKTKRINNIKQNNMLRSKIMIKCPLLQRKFIKKKVLQKRIQIQANKSQTQLLSNQKIQFASDKTLFEKTMKQLSQGNLFINPQQQSLIQFAFDQMKQKISYESKINGNVWDLECDKAHNFKFYFKNFNSEELNKKSIKRQKSKSFMN